MALPSKQFYLTQMELGLEKLVEKILFFIAVKNENLMVTIGFISDPLVLNGLF